MSGKMGRCIDTVNNIDPMYDVGIAEVSIITPHTYNSIKKCMQGENLAWFNYDITFDNIFIGFLNLFILST